MVGLPLQFVLSEPLSFTEPYDDAEENSRALTVSTRANGILISQVVLWMTTK